MRLIYFTLCLTLFFINCFSQRNTIELFYEKKNESLKDFATTKDTLSLLKFYDSCLDAYSQKLLTNIEFEDNSAFDMACRLKQYEIAERLLNHYIKSGTSIYQIEYWAKNIYEDFFLSPEGLNVVKNYTHFHEIYKKNLQIEYFSQITSLSALDQYSRSILSKEKLHNIGFDFKLNTFNYINDSTRSQIESDLIRITDSLGFVRVVELIKKYGYPSESKAGKGSLGFLLAHYHGNHRNIYIYDQSSTSFFDSIMLLAVSNGDINNRLYAMHKDYPDYPYDVNFANIYGTGIRTTKNLYLLPNEIVDIKNVDKRRSQIFLPPLWVDALIYNFELPIEYPVPEEAKPYFQNR